MYDLHAVSIITLVIVCIYIYIIIRDNVTHEGFREFDYL